MKTATRLVQFSHETSHTKMTGVSVSLSNPCISVRALRTLQDINVKPGLNINLKKLTIFKQIDLNWPEVRLSKQEDWRLLILCPKDIIISFQRAPETQLLPEYYQSPKTI
ncbi:hypothetical protein AMECASPLE_004999 [Ameca splendens]|uniref:Uncharacterized protein n=1 Tax=Ameca splendens TaxID=208324 RepID=A0ABV0ZUX0_9TELE